MPLTLSVASYDTPGRGGGSILQTVAPPTGRAGFFKIANTKDSSD